ncbi:O-antigen ligase family protein [Metallibacterium sp.]|uniref:O-antigen ligase family protein n=1 Tax=Metallibacterium sp. TaxID=2940281 RepID=UPI0026029AF4|nr:O-antigen ligase family protein [Metallibacterium sp.]
MTHLIAYWHARRRQPWQTWLGLGALALVALTAVSNLPQPLQSSTAAALALLALLLSGAQPWRTLRRHPVPWLILALLLYCLAQAALVAQPGAQLGYARQLTLSTEPLKVLVYACVFGWWLACYPQWIMRVLKLMALGWLLWALAQLPWLHLDALTTGTLRLRLGYAENLTGAFAALVLLIGMCGAWLCRRDDRTPELTGLRSDAWALLTLAALLVLLFAQSRGAWLAAVVGAAILFVLGRAPRRSVSALRWRTWIGLGVLAFALIAYVARPAVLQRFDGGGTAALSVLDGGAVSAAAPSVGLRLELWRFAVHMIAQRPMLGWGLASIQPAIAAHGIAWQGYVPPHLHDTPLQVAAGMGLIGLLLLGAAFLLPLRDLLRAWRRDIDARPQLALLLALCVVLLTVNLFDYLAWSNGYMRGPLEIVLGCAMAVSLRWRSGEPVLPQASG